MAINVEKLKIIELQNKTEQYSELINPIIDRVIKPYTRDLDKYMEKANNLIDSDTPITDADLDNIILILPKLIYWASEGIENIGIKEDLSKSMRDEEFIKAYANKIGSISQKNMETSLDVINEELSHLIYSHSKNKLKLKVSYAIEMLQSAKKIASKRMVDNDWVSTKSEPKNYQPQNRRRIY